MAVLEATILHHVCIVFLLLWILSLFNCFHPIAYIISVIYLYLVHERYVLRLRRKLRFEERRNCSQRRALSDSETLRWLNHAVEKIWPVCMEEIVSQKILLPIIPWFLHKYKPWTVKKAVVQRLYMGRSPPMFTEMRVLRQCTGDDHLVLELGMNFKSADDMSAILAVKLRKRLGFGMRTKLHLKGMHVEGKVLIGVKFLRQWPFLGRLRVCFAEPPYFQMTVKPIFTHGLDVTEFPGIAGWLDNLLALAFEQTLVEPNMLVVDMEKFVSPQPETWFFVDEKEPVGYALVEVIEAVDMKPSDLNGLADPYVKGQLGPYRFRTKTQRKTLAPKWHEEFKVPLCTWESLNALAIQVRDKDHFVDDTLGDCSIYISNLRGGQRHDMWLPLQNIKIGRLHLAITVVEANRKGQEQPGYSEPIIIENERDLIPHKSAHEGRHSPAQSERSTEVADKLEAIDIEGQEETGIWVHQPGSEVSQIWEPRKGKNMLLDATILRDCSDSVGKSSSASRSYKNDNSSTDGSEGGKKVNSSKKMMRGIKQIGSAFRKNSRKEDDKEESISYPRFNLKAANEYGVKLVVEDPSPIETSKTEGRKSVDRNGQGSPSKRHVKGMAKSILKHAGKSARSVKNAFSQKGSKSSLGDSETVSIEEEIDISVGSVCSDEVSAGSSVSTSEGIPVFSKVISVSGDESLKSGELTGEITPNGLNMKADDIITKATVEDIEDTVEGPSTASEETDGLIAEEFSDIKVREERLEEDKNQVSLL